MQNLVCAVKYDRTWLIQAFSPVNGPWRARSCNIYLKFHTFGSRGSRYKCFCKLYFCNESQCICLQAGPLLLGISKCPPTQRRGRLHLATFSLASLYHGSLPSSAREKIISTYAFLHDTVRSETTCPSIYRSILKVRPGNASRELSEYPSRSKNTLFLLSAAQSIANLFDLESCPANLIWPSFGNTKVFQVFVR
jgi:hypothetical protein